MQSSIKVKDVIKALNRITHGRVPTRLEDLYSSTNPFVLMKSSNLPGKSIMETPGLVFGDPEKKIKKIGISMTLTESAIELAGGLEIDAIICHHPIADAANTGGVLIKTYLGLYNIALFELHEAFHGMHPGISYIHGHAAYRVEIAYGGIPGNVMYIGKALKGIDTLGDILNRINDFMNVDEEEKLLEQEKKLRNINEIYETSTVVRGEILLGNSSSKVRHILHIFPHTSFTVEHLETVLQENPEIDTVLTSISRVKPEHELVKKSKELGLNFILGNSHALEIYENGIPLGIAIQKLLPGSEVIILQERRTAFPLNKFGSEKIQQYGEMITDKYLLKED